MIDRNILQGILDSKNFLQLASEIPCDIIQTLETDASQAELFVEQIEHGEVPTIIQNLPNEIVDAFQTLVGIALELPAALLKDAKSAVDEAVHIFDDIEDGQIVSDIGQLPGEIETDVTSLWGDVTSDVVGGWNDFTHGAACFFEGGCASPTTGACLSGTTPASVAATQTPTTAAYSGAYGSAVNYSGSSYQIPTGPNTTVSPDTGQWDSLARRSTCQWIFAVSAALFGVLIQY